MKKLFLPFIFCLISSPLLKAAGGPDAYGYTWLTSLDPGGPTAQFIDISGYGTLVTGLADDNSAAGMVNIGFPFHYYWNDYTQMKIGSNGWASFSNTSNIASCFPSIPNAGGANDYLALLMGDLNFTGAGNPGQVYTYTNNVDTFIIMYKNVPFWSISAPGYTGSNSCEIILCKSDSSITFQYQNLSTLLNNAGCIDMTVGIENSTGTIGLQVHSDAMPPSNYAIKFIYPQVVLISIQDLTPRWNLNAENGAVFIPTGSFNLTSNIKNVGNTSIVTPITTNVNIKDATNTTVFSSSYPMSTLAAGDDSTFTFPTSPNLITTGQYSYETIITNSSDINAGNNTLITEIDMVNICTATFLLNYTNSGLPNGSLNWNGGANDDGMAVHFVPPVYPVTIEQMQVYVSSNVSDGLIPRIYADDGPGGSAGTLLYSGATIPAGSIVTNNWNTLVTTPVTINSGGFYITYFQTGTTIFVGTQSGTPLSRRNYEILDGSWAVYRENEVEELMIRCLVSNPNYAGPAQPGPIVGPVSLCEGSTAEYSISPVSATDSYTWNLPAGWSGTSNADTISVLTDATGGTISVSANGVCGSSTPQTLNVTINPLPAVTANATEDTLCDGEQTILTGGGATSYVWSGGVSDAIAFTPVATDTYSVIGTDANNCSDTTSILITVNPLPIVTANATEDTVCNGDQTILTGSGADSFLWNAGIIDGVPYAPVLTDTYAVTGTDANGCTNTASITIVVNPLPPVTFNYPGSDTICINHGIQVLSGGTPMSGSYSGTGVSGTNFDPAIAGTGTHTITFSYTETDGCTNSASTDIVVLGCAGLNSEEKISISVYPNPFTNTITISGIESGAQIELYNSLGEVLQNMWISETNPVIETSSLSSGVYFLKILVGTKNITQKIIKQ